MLKQGRRWTIVIVGIPLGRITKQLRPFLLRQVSSQVHLLPTRCHGRSRPRPFCSRHKALCINGQVFWWHVYRGLCNWVSKLSVTETCWTGSWASRFYFYTITHTDFSKEHQRVEIVDKSVRHWVAVPYSQYFQLPARECSASWEQLPFRVLLLRSHAKICEPKVCWQFLLLTEPVIAQRYKMILLCWHLTRRVLNSILIFK